jgi:hypothetical protein
MAPNIVVVRILTIYRNLKIIFGITLAGLCSEIIIRSIIADTNVTAGSNTTGLKIVCLPVRFYRVPHAAVQQHGRHAATMSNQDRRAERAAATLVPVMAFVIIERQNADAPQVFTAVRQTAIPDSVRRVLQTIVVLEMRQPAPPVPRRVLIVIYRPAGPVQMDLGHLIGNK